MGTISATFEAISEAVLEVIVQKYALYLSLIEKAEVKDSADIFQDILTLFSMDSSVVQDTKDSQTMEQRITGMIERYYKQLNQGSANAIGTTAVERMNEELIDIVHTVSPFFEKSVWLAFFNDLPNSAATKTAFKNVESDYSTVILIVVLAVIKANCMLLKVSELMKKPIKGKRVQRSIES